jgi:hypothetical protein
VFPMARESHPIDRWAAIRGLAPNRSEETLPSVLQPPLTNFKSILNSSPGSPCRPGHPFLQSVTVVAVTIFWHESESAHSSDSDRKAPRDAPNRGFWGPRLGLWH